MRLSEPIQRSIRISSLAALAGLIPHYLLFYFLGSALLTDQMGQWIMARTPSRYAVATLDYLGNWAKPSANTGALAALGFVLFLSRWLSSFVPAKWRIAAGASIGILLAGVVAWNCGYASVLGGVAFWGPALVMVTLVPARRELSRSGSSASPVDLMDRRTAVASVTRYGLPLLMSSGVIGVAAESYWRDQSLARRAPSPIELFPFVPALDRQSFGAGLVRAAVTPVEQFYGMSKNTVDPAIDAKTWTLTIRVNGKPVRRIRYAELLAMPRQTRYVTLRCISNTLKSDLMGTAEWAGVCLAQLIDPKVLPRDVIEAVFVGAEGHDDSLKLDYAFGEETLLALGMNGKTLSRTHGFPVRLLAPRYYGCRNVKWISAIDFVSKPYFGTWQRLGYTKEPVIHTASHVDHMRRDGSLIQFGGVSFAGIRGIRAVRVRANGGAWDGAKLEAPLSGYTWTRWIAQLHAPEGAQIEVNAQDGNGRWQELAEANPFPNGPDGPTIVVARV